MSKGILFGATIGAATGALTGGVNGAIPAPAFNGLSSLTSPQYLLGAANYLGANIAAGTVLNAGTRAVEAYAGGIGSLGRVLSSAFAGAGSGFGQESGIDLLGLGYGGLVAAGGFTMNLPFGLTVSVSSESSGLGKIIKYGQTIYNSYLLPDYGNHPRGCDES